MYTRRYQSTVWSVDDDFPTLPGRKSLKISLWVSSARVLRANVEVLDRLGGWGSESGAGKSREKKGSDLELHFDGGCLEIDSRAELVGMKVMLMLNSRVDDNGMKS